MAGTLDSENAGRAARGQDTTRRILCVDDDPVIRCLAEEQLKSDGFEIVTVGDGDAAWAELRGGQFDLALVDLGMPGVDGFGLIEYIRSKPALVDLPIIVVTSNADAGSVQRAFGLGATSFITKPVNWPLLAHQVQLVLRANATEAALRSVAEEDHDCEKKKASYVKSLHDELGMPLHHMVGFGEIVRRRLEHVDDARDIADHVDAIVQSGALLLENLHDIVVVAELGSGEKHLDRRKVGVAGIISGIAEKARRAAGQSGVELEIREGSAETEIECDADLLSRALVNMVAHAAKRAPSGAAVELGTTTGEGGGLEIVVAGTVVPADRLGTQEGKPVSGEPLAEGGASSRIDCGLGLSFARIIANLHGWSLEVADNPGESFRAVLAAPVAGQQQGKLRVAYV